MPRRRIIVRALGLVILGAIAVPFLHEPGYSGSISIDGRILVFAHRGFGNHAPDNSLAGARIAVQQGLDGVDVDAQLTRDAEIVIFHDVSLERFTHGQGRVDAKSLEELRAYDLAEKYGHGFKDARIASFEDFVAELTPDALLMVELKVPGFADTGIERRAIDIIARHQAFDRVYLSSFNPVVLWRLERLEPRIRTVFAFMDTGWDPKRVAETRPEDRVTLPWYLRNDVTRRAIRNLVGPDALSIRHDVDEDTIEALLAKGYPVFLWPVNEEAEIRRALSRRPFAVISDEPMLALRLRDQSAD
ncbi:MAG: glycerophosphodiester phosphodiesterase [Gammaproteobacteria bacterium]